MSKKKKGRRKLLIAVIVAAAVSAAITASVAWTGAPDVGAASQQAQIKCEFPTVDELETGYAQGQRPYWDEQCEMYRAYEVEVKKYEPAIAAVNVILHRGSFRQDQHARSVEVTLNMQMQVGSTGIQSLQAPIISASPDLTDNKAYAGPVILTVNGTQEIGRAEITLADPDNIVLTREGGMAWQPNTAVTLYGQLFYSIKQP